MASNKNQKLHAIMVSLHLQGHITPYVNLALKLASNGFSITFAHLEFIHHQISKSQHNNPTDIDIFSEARKSGLDIDYTTISDGFPVEFDRPANQNQFLESFMYEFPDKVDELVSKVIQSNSSSSSPSRLFLIADTFSLWSEKIAKKYGLVNVSFWTEPALVFSLYYHLDLLRENGHVPVNGREQNVDYVPGIESINMKHLMSYLHDSELDTIHKVIFTAFDNVKNADFVLCNTVEELEVETISALRKNQGFYAIGPVFALDFGTDSVPRSLLPEFECKEWLNGKEDKSVLYVSFGSLAKISDKSLIFEIASGILLSGVDFIWAFRPGIVEGNDGVGIFPDGFKDKGLVVPWCDQSSVLMDRAIGGFLTHCGWNSVLESLWCGVPMICYPLFTDQPTNRKVVVDDWGVGMDLCDGGCVGREEVAKKIRCLMSGKRSGELRKEVKKVRETMERALGEGGSSEKNFDSFVRDLSNELKRRYEKI